MSKTKSYVKEERNVKTQGIKNKRLHLKVYFLLYIQRFMIIFLCSLAALLILIMANKVYKKRTTEILPVMNDITQVGKFSYQAQMTVSEVPIYVLRPDIPVKYFDIRHILMQDIDELSKMTSIENTKFSPDFQKKVNENICPWINLPNCTVMGMGSMTQGIVASIHYIQQSLIYYITLFNSLTPTLGNLLTLLQAQNTLELFYLLYHGIVPAINHLIEETTLTLFEILDSGASFIIKFAIVGALMAIFVLISILFYIYPQLTAERKVICQTLLLIPPHMVVRNRLIKEFLLKEAKIFHGFIKDNMEEKNSFILNVISSK
jgi:hypothetical protein